MKKNRILSFVTAIAFAVMSLSSCSEIQKIKQIDITSAHITSLTPKGLTNIDLGCRVGINNPSIQLSFSEITCAIKHSGKVLGNVAIDPFTLKGRSEEVYDLNANAKLGKDMSVIEAMNLLNSNIMNELTADLNARVQLKGGLSKRVKLKDVPLKKLIELVK